MGCQFAHFRLGQPAQWKERVRKLLLRQAKEKVGLILRQILGALQNPASALRVELVHRIVAGGDALRPNRARGLEQLIEL